MDLREVVQTKLLPLTQSVATDALHDVELFRFDKTDPHQLYTVCIYGSVVEIAYGCIALLEKKQVTALPILLRSLLEAYADFRASIEDQQYYKNLYASFLKEKLRLITNAEKNQQNPYLAGLVRAPDINTEKANLQVEIDRYKNENRGPLMNQDRFNRGKLEYESQSIYWLLCLHGHNNLSALEDRHIEKQNADYNVVLFKEEDPEDLVRYLEILIEILIDSTERIHKLLGTETTLRYQKHREIFDAARTIYTKSNNA